MNYIKFFKLLLLSFLINILLIVSLYIQRNNYENAIQVQQDEIEVVKDEKMFLEERLLKANEDVEMLEQKYTKKEVYFTNYYQGDGSSSSKVGAGLTTKDFTIGKNDWYYYNGMVVLAGATNEGLRSDYGVLAKYKTPEKGIKYYDYYDVIVFEIDGVKYKGVVIDTCGSSMDIDYLNKVDGGINRIDIFIADKKYAFGKVKGVIYEWQVTFLKL